MAGKEVPWMVQQVWLSTRFQSPQARVVCLRSAAGCNFLANPHHRKGRLHYVEVGLDLTKRAEAAASNRADEARARRQTLRIGIARCNAPAANAD